MECNTSFACVKSFLWYDQNMYVAQPQLGQLNIRLYEIIDVIEEQWKSVWLQTRWLWVQTPLNSMNVFHLPDLLARKNMGLNITTYRAISRIWFESGEWIVFKLCSFCPLCYIRYEACSNKKWLFHVFRCNCWCVS